MKVIVSWVIVYTRRSVFDRLLYGLQEAPSVYPLKGRPADQGRRHLDAEITCGPKVDGRRKRTDCTTGICAGTSPFSTRPAATMTAQRLAPAAACHTHADGDEDDRLHGYQDGGEFHG